MFNISITLVYEVSTNLFTSNFCCLSVVSILHLQASEVSLVSQEMCNHQSRLHFASGGCRIMSVIGVDVKSGGTALASDFQDFKGYLDCAATLEQKGKIAN